MIAARLREQRAAIVADASLRGRKFSEALAVCVDDALVASFTEIDKPDGLAVVALGSYGRRELCPGSDVDVLLVHNFKSRRHLGTMREITEIALADEDLDALTAMLEIRHLAGDASLTAELERRARELALRRQSRVLRALADAAELRRLRPGPVAEMLEPDLKEGAGGLRDVQSFEWAGWAFGPPGATDALLARGYVTDADLARVTAGRELLLDVRVALQRSTGSRSDLLALQEQDAVASALGVSDADALVRDLSRSSREIAWTAADLWSRIRDGLRGPSGRAAHADRVLVEGVALRDGRIHVEVDPNGRVPALRALEAASEAADHDMRFDRTSLTRLRATEPPTWNLWERAAFLRLLRAGRKAVAVFEALDHEGVLTLLLPEWEHVRSLPQRNAYHRFTVDRHLLEAVAQCALLLDAGDAPDIAREDVDAVVARACRRPELLLLGALLHDIAKGRPGNHSEGGAATAEVVARRIGLDSEGREIVVWLVRNHLLMAEVATRRDLSDPSVTDNLAERCAGDAERLRLLYLLTIGDSRATGPAAWSPSKAALVRDLFIKAATAIERGATEVIAADRREAMAERLGAESSDAFLSRLPHSYLLAFSVDTMVAHADWLEPGQGLTVHCVRDNGQVDVTVVARDRPRLLATLSGALTIAGLDVLEATLFGTTDGLALDVFRTADPFGRVGEDDTDVARTIERALSGDLDVARRVEERRRAYLSPGLAAGPVAIEIAADESEKDTVVEVHADDDVGLLYRLASAFADLNLDVRVAKVATLGARVVDVFYVRDATGGKITGGVAVEQLRAALRACLGD
jgi:[protein-PII] uridylyltransferase